MPFADREFDAVVSCHSLEHSFAPDVALAEFVRVLKPGGVLAIEVPSKNRPIDAPRPQSQCASDRWEFGSAAMLVKQVAAQAANGITVLYSQDAVVGRTGEQRVQLVIRTGD